MRRKKRSRSCDNVEQQASDDRASKRPRKSVAVGSGAAPSAPDTVVWEWRRRLNDECQRFVETAFDKFCRLPTHLKLVTKPTSTATALDILLQWIERLVGSHGLVAEKPSHGDLPRSLLRIDKEYAREIETAISSAPLGGFEVCAHPWIGPGNGSDVVSHLFENLACVKRDDMHCDGDQLCQEGIEENRVAPFYWTVCEFLERLRSIYERTVILPVSLHKLMDVMEGQPVEVARLVLAYAVDADDLARQRDFAWHVLTRDGQEPHDGRLAARLEWITESQFPYAAGERQPSELLEVAYAVGDRMRLVVQWVEPLLKQWDTLSLTDTSMPEQVQKALNILDAWIEPDLRPHIDAHLSTVRDRAWAHLMTMLYHDRACYAYLTSFHTSDAIRNAYLHKSWPPHHLLDHPTDPPNRFE